MRGWNASILQRKAHDSYRYCRWEAALVWIDAAANGTVTEYDSEPDVSFMRRASVWFLAFCRSNPSGKRRGALK